jgi:hypothetical protein
LISSVGSVSLSSLPSVEYIRLGIIYRHTHTSFRHGFSCTFRVDRSPGSRNLCCWISIWHGLRFAIRMCLFRSVGLGSIRGSVVIDEISCRGFHSKLTWHRVRPTLNRFGTGCHSRALAARPIQLEVCFGLVSLPS